MSQNSLPDYLDHIQAVILNIVIIGEAATKLLKDYEVFLDRHPDVPWKSMKGMRNRVAHGYFDINLDVVWETVQTALPVLLERLPGIRIDAGPPLTPPARSS